MPYNPRGAFTRLETIGCRSGVAFSKPRVPLMTRQAGKSHNRRGKKRMSCSSVNIARARCTFFFPGWFTIHSRYSSSVEVSYFATFGTYIIRRDDIGSWDVARATRSKKDDVYVENERERERELWEGERMNGEEAERKRERKREGRARMVHGWRDTVNRWEAINFGLECPIAPHFVQCKFTPDANHPARALRSLSAAEARTGKRMWCSISDNSFFFRNIGLGCDIYF